MREKIKQLICPSDGHTMKAIAVVFQCPACGGAQRIPLNLVDLENIEQ